MAVASIALFVSLGGSSIAAINYARNAGKVDGKDAVKAGASLKRAAGDLVATQRRGPDRGKIPSKFLDDVAKTHSFAQNIEVADNLQGAPAPLGDIAGVGNFTVTCADQNNSGGVEDPTSTVAFNSTAAVNLSKRIGGANGQVLPQPAGTTQTVTINGSNTFEFQIQVGNTNLLVQGVVRQDGRNTPAANCLAYGTLLRVEA